MILDGIHQHRIIGQPEQRLVKDFISSKRAALITGVDGLIMRFLNGDKTGQAIRIRRHLYQSRAFGFEQFAYRVQVAHFL